MIKNVLSPDLFSCNLNGIMPEFLFYYLMYISSWRRPVTPIFGMKFDLESIISRYKKKRWWQARFEFFGDTVSTENQKNERVNGWQSSGGTG